MRNANGDYALTAPTLPAVEEGEPVEPEEERKEVEGRLLEMLSNRTKQSSESGGYLLAGCRKAHGLG